MKKIQSLLIGLLPVTGMLAQAPVIHSVTPVSTNIEQYGRFEAGINLSATFTNPFDYDQIQVQAQINTPDGVQEIIDGFYIQPYQITDAQTGTAGPLGNGLFKIRYAPIKTGNYQYKVRCITPSGSAEFQTLSFTCIPGQNAGFVRSNLSNFLHTDNGNQLIPVGENMAWQQNNIYLDYTRWLGNLKAKNGNYIRLWMCHWGLGLEWRTGVYGYEGLRKYQQINAFWMDWLLDYCAQQGIYVMLCLHHHGQVSSSVNPNWYESPYNSANGGMCANTWDFFTNANAKNTVKNRLRYIVARWGYQRSILAWELFNEVDWTDNFSQYKGDVSSWHAEMAAYLKNLDVRKHLVTTSYALDENDPQTWNQPDIAFTQTHYYVDAPNIERVLAGGNQRFLSNYDKPTLNGEFGLGGSSNGLASLDPNGIHVHNCLWGGLFSGGMGSGMQWWWDTYVEPQHLYDHFAGISETAASVPLKAGNFRPFSVKVEDAPADLSLTPALGWGELPDTLFAVASGQPNPVLGQFLYGAQWNTQFRRPPHFVVNYPKNGTFSVQTGPFAGFNPAISISIDGQQVLNESAVIQQTYTVNVPAGQHTILVDNTGTDWITISAYIFSDIGSAVDVYALRSADEKRLSGWVLHNLYNHTRLHDAGAPDPVANARMTVENWPNGNYLLKWFSTLSGQVFQQENVLVSNGHLQIQIPELLWDAAFYLEDALSPVVGPPALIQLEWKFSPNPARPGTRLQFQFDQGLSDDVKIELLDESGKALQVLLYTPNVQLEQALELPLPAGLPAGLYWIKCSTGRKIGVKPLIVAAP